MASLVFCTKSEVASKRGNPPANSSRPDQTHLMHSRASDEWRLLRGTQIVVANDPDR